MQLILLMSDNTAFQSKDCLLLNTFDEGINSMIHKICFYKDIYKFNFFVFVSLKSGLCANQ